MTGLFLLAVLGIWLAIVRWLVKLISTRLPETWWRMPVCVLLYMALLPLPVADEIVGGWQFKQLCHEYSTIKVDRSKATGRIVYLKSHPEIDVQGTWVPIKLHHWQFVDATTGETVLSYNSLQSTSGLLIRMLKISEGNVPLTFKGSCEPKGSPASIQTFKDFGINYIEPPIKKNGEIK